MNELLQLKGRFDKRGNEGMGPIGLPTHKKVTSEHIGELICQLIKVKEYWSDKEDIAGVIVSVHYIRVVAKSNRLKILLADAGKKPVDSIRGAKFVTGKDNQGKTIHKHVFTHYVQASAIDKAINNLQIVKEIVDLFNGTIEVQSEVNKGSTFHIHMDMQIVDLETSVSDNKALNLKVLQGRCVLLAEDHPMNQEIAQRLLASVGVSVHIANNGKEAVDEFEQHSDQYDAVLMDMRMPVMDGLQAAKAIRALNLPKAEKIPIIAMTANAFSEDRKETARAGMNEHLAKPIEPKLLYEVLAEWITKQL